MQMWVTLGLGSVTYEWYVIQTTVRRTIGRCPSWMVSWTMPPIHCITDWLSTGVLSVKDSTEMPVVIKLYNPSFQNVSQ